MIKGEYISASPCDPVDLPQTLLEPILVSYATQHGFKCRFDTEFLSFVENEEAGTITTTLRDNISRQILKIQSRFLFGADGARSSVLRQLDLPLIKEPTKGVAMNVLVKADLSHLMEYRMGNLHWIVQPDVEHPDFAFVGIVRMVKPWHEWIFIMLPDPRAPPTFNPSEADYLKRVKEFIGDDSIPAEILGISRWTINEIVAEHYSKGLV